MSSKKGGCIILYRKKSKSSPVLLNSQAQPCYQGSRFFPSFCSTILSALCFIYYGDKMTTVVMGITPSRNKVERPEGHFLLSNNTVGWGGRKVYFFPKLLQRLPQNPLARSSSHISL